MIEQQIATLTGRIQWLVDSSKLVAMTNRLRQVQRQMLEVGRTATELEKKLNLKLGLKPADTTAKAKLDKSIALSLDRQSKAETQVQKLRRATFTAELAGQKLLFAGKKEAAYLTTADVRHQQNLAVLASKQQKTELDRLKVQGQQIKNEDAIATAKARQTRAEAIHQQIVQRTASLKAQEYKAMNAAQRVQQAMTEAAERGRRAALKFNQQQAKNRVTDQRQTERFAMAQERHAAFQARQQVWQANRDKPQPTSLLGLSGAPLVLTSITAGLASVVAAVEGLGARIQARQDGASEAQNFNNALNTAGGKSVDNQRIARDAYFNISDKFGTEVSLEGAKDYAKFVQGQLALGKSLTQAIQVFSDQSATFRAAALNGEAQKRAAYQLNQIRAKGKPEGSDVNDLFDAVGGPVASSIRDAAAQRLGFKGKPEEEAGWFKAQVTAGKILAKDFDQGMANFLKANQDILAKQMKSIDASQTRADNQKYLNEVGLNSDIELTQAVQDNIKAHQELNAAMQPALTAFRDLDTALTNLSAFFLRFLIGKNPDGTDAPSTEAAKRVDSLAPDKAAVDTAAFNGAAVDGKLSTLQDPVDRLWNKLFGKSPDMPKNAEAPQVDISDDMTGKLLPIIRNMPQPMTASDVAQMQSRTGQNAMSRLNANGTPMQTSAPAEPSTVNNDHSVNIERIHAPITVNAPEGVSAKEVAEMIHFEFYNELGMLTKRLYIQGAETH